jgi:hypothetical protein
VLCLTVAAFAATRPTLTAVRLTGPPPEPETATAGGA